MVCSRCFVISLHLFAVVFCLRGHFVLTLKSLAGEYIRCCFILIIHLDFCPFQCSFNTSLSFGFIVALENIIIVELFFTYSFCCAVKAHSVAAEWQPWTDQFILSVKIHVFVLLPGFYFPGNMAHDNKAISLWMSPCSLPFMLAVNTPLLTLHLFFFFFPGTHNMHMHTHRACCA